MMGKNIGIDLGSSTALMYLSQSGKIVKEPSVIATDGISGKILAAGNEAEILCGRIPGAAKMIYPFRAGINVESKYFTFFVAYMLKNAEIKGLFHPNLLFCMSADISEEDENRIYDIVRRLGVKDVMVIDKMVAAAVGCGIAPDRDDYNIIIDIGGAQSEIALISKGSCELTQRIKIGGDTLDAAIAGYIAEKHGLRINFHEAERIKIELGGVWKRDSILKSEVVGTNISDGLPNTAEISSKEIFAAIAPHVKQFAIAVRTFLKQLDVDKKAEIAVNGIMLTGGGSLLYGLPKLLEEVTALSVTVAKDPIASAAIGFERLSEIL